MGELVRSDCVARAISLLRRRTALCLDYMLLQPPLPSSFSTCPLKDMHASVAALARCRTPISTAVRPQAILRCFRRASETRMMVVLLDLVVELYSVTASNQDPFGFSELTQKLGLEAILLAYM